jgi:hypothetical protein
MENNSTITGLPRIDTILIKSRAEEYRRLRWAVAQVKKIIKKLNTLPA